MSQAGTPWDQQQLPANTPIYGTGPITGAPGTLGSQAKADALLGLTVSRLVTILLGVILIIAGVFALSRPSTTIALPE